MLVIKQLSPRRVPMAWGFSLLTVQIVDDFSVRLVYLLVVLLHDFLLLTYTFSFIYVTKTAKSANKG